MGKNMLSDFTTEFLRAPYSPVTEFQFDKVANEGGLGYTSPPVVTVTLQYDSLTEQNGSNPLNHELTPVISLVSKVINNKLYYTGFKVHWMGSNVPASLDNTYISAIAMINMNTGSLYNFDVDVEENMENYGNDSYIYPQRIYNDKNILGQVDKCNDIDWYIVSFDISGQANFWVRPLHKDLDVDIEIYGEDNLKNSIASSVKGNGIDDLVTIDVEASKNYYIKIKHFGDIPSGENGNKYWLRCKVYQKTTMVYYSQEDPRWKNIMYSSHGDSKQTIGTSGCGPTSMAMVVSTLNNKEIFPPELCKYAVVNGFRTYNDGTSHAFFQSAAQNYNLKYESTTSVDIVSNKLNAGDKMVICSLGKGHFTSGGHFIVLYGTERVNGEIFFLVMDPNMDNTRYWRNGTDGVVLEHYNENDGFVKVKALKLHEENKYKKYHILSK